MTVTLMIDGTDRSSRLVEVELWRQTMEGVGRFKLLLHNDDNALLGVFAPQMVVQISPSAADLMLGYIDDIRPTVRDVDENYHERVLEITGRDYGQDLMNKVIDKTYPSQSAELVLEDILTTSGCELTLDHYGAFPTLPYRAKRKHVIDAVRDIITRIGYDCFPTIAKKLEVFEPGNKTSGITLKSISGDVTNRILQIDRLEAEGIDVYNYILLYGKKVDDGWTEGNAADWSIEVGMTASDITDTAYIAKGAASLKFEKGTATVLRCSLHFPKYNYAYLDANSLASATLSIMVYEHVTVAPAEVTVPKITLYDTNGDCIQYLSSTRHIAHLDAIAGKWGLISVPIGLAVKIDPFSPTAQDKWTYCSGHSAFNWLINKIEIEQNELDLDWFILDGLSVPWSMIATAQDATSQKLYGIRYWPEDRYDVESQIELQAIADQYLRIKKNPTDKLFVVCDGDAGLIAGVWKWLPGYKVHLEATAEGVHADYRLLDIHHIFKRDAGRGWAHIVEANYGDLNNPVEVDFDRHLEESSPVLALLKTMHDQIAQIKEEESRNDIYPKPPAPLSAKGIILDGSTPWEKLNINIPHDNMVLNADFEVDNDGDGVPDNWSTTNEAGAPTFSLDTTKQMEGKQSAKILCAVGQSGWLNSDFIKVVTSRAYIFRVFMLMKTALSGTLHLRVSWFKKDQTASVTTYTDIYSGMLVSLDTWIEKEGVATVPNDAVYCKVALILNNVGGSGTASALFDSVNMFRKIVYADRIDKIIGDGHIIDDAGILNNKIALQGSGQTLRDWDDVISEISYMKTSFLTPNMGARQRKIRDVETVGSLITIQDGGANWVLVEEFTIKSVADVKLVLEEMTFRVYELAALRSCYVQLRYQFADGSETTYYTSGEIFTGDCPYEYTHTSQVIGNTNQDLTLRWYMRVLGSAPNWGSMDKRLSRTSSQQFRVNM